MKKIFSAILVVIATILIIEGMLQVFPSMLPTQVRSIPTLIPDPRLGDVMPTNIDEVKYTLDGKPFRVQTNSIFDIGLRDEKKYLSNTYAVVIGDSFVYGHGVEAEDTFTEVLQSSTGKEFVNMGMPGFGSTQAAKLYEIYGSQLEPEVVVLVFFENDYLDNLIFEGRVEPEPLTYWMRQNVGIYKLGRFVKNFDYQGGVWKEYNAGGEPSFFYSGFFEEKLFIENGEHMKELMVESFIRIDSQDAESLIVFIPYKENFYQEEIDGTGLNFEYRRDAFNEACSSLQLNCLDLSPRFEEEVGNGARLYLSPFDGHLNEYGNIVVADEMERKLNEK